MLNKILKKCRLKIGSLLKIQYKKVITIAILSKIWYYRMQENKKVGKKMYRTKNCGELTIKNIEETVELSGWIQKIRNLGGMIFIDLRDEFGITQIVIKNELEEQAKDLNTESCIHISRKSCGKRK